MFIVTPTKLPSIYQYMDPILYLEEVLRARQNQQPRFSIKAWARKIDGVSPSLLTSILGKRRKLTPTVAKAIAEELSLSLDEIQFFTILTKIQSATSRERPIWMGQLSDLRVKSEQVEISKTTFTGIRSWYRVAIFEMLGLRDFKLDSTYVRNRLAFPIKLKQVYEVFSQFKKVGLLKKNKKGRYTRTKRIKFGDTAPNFSIREYHRETLDLGKEALELQPMEDRDYRATTLAIRKEDLTQIKAILQEAHRRIQALSAPGKADHVVQIHSQLFRLTR